MLHCVYLTPKICTQRIRLAIKNAQEHTLAWPKLKQLRTHNMNVALWQVQLRKKILHRRVALFHWLGVKQLSQFSQFLWLRWSKSDWYRRNLSMFILHAVKHLSTYMASMKHKTGRVKPRFLLTKQWLPPPIQQTKYSFIPDTTTNNEQKTCPPEH